MGILDTLKGLFSKKDITEKIKDWAENGDSGRLVKFVTDNNPTEIRLAAIDALKEIKKDDLCVTTLMRLLDDDAKEIVLAAAKSLCRVGTKREVDVLRYKADNAQDPEIAKAISDAAVESKERTPQF